MNNPSPTGWQKLVWRDLWNVGASKVFSRRIRKFWLKHSLKQFGDRAFFSLDVFIHEPWGISVGEGTVINRCCVLDGRGEGIEIGSNVDIGMHSHIWSLEHDPNDANHSTRSAKVIIKDNVWIATRVSVMPGITIGKGAVVGAGSIVTRDVPDMAIVAGVPARVIGSRHNPLTYKLDFNPRFR